jgi:hypothetical protein
MGLQTQLKVSTKLLRLRIRKIPHLKDDIAEAKLRALLNESSPSESEYKAPDDSVEDSESEGEEDDEDTATAGKGKKAFKKKKTGVLTREEITAAVAAMSDDQQDDMSSIRTARSISRFDPCFLMIIHILHTVYSMRWVWGEQAKCLRTYFQHQIVLEVQLITSHSSTPRARNMDGCVFTIS